jgi:hypothetical protein
MLCATWRLFWVIGRPGRGSYSYLCTRQNGVPAEGTGLAWFSLRKDAFMVDSDNSAALAEIVALLKSIETFVKKIAAEIAER